jgi:hypothetical protein
MEVYWRNASLFIDRSVGIWYFDHSIHNCPMVQLVAHQILERMFIYN